MLDGHLSSSGILDHEMGMFREIVEYLGVDSGYKALVDGDPDQSAREALGHRSQVVSVLPIEPESPSVLSQVELGPLEVLLKNELSVANQKDAVDLMPRCLVEVRHEVFEQDRVQSRILKGFGLPAVSDFLGHLIGVYPRLFRR